MRGTLGAAGLLLVAGALIVAPTNAMAIGGLNTVTVSPGHGKAAAQFQVTYAISPCQAAAGLTIAFSWNGLTPAGQVLGTALTNSACRATLTTVPPVNAATHQAPPPGTYQVFGYVPLPNGTPTPNTEASTTYTVDVTPAPTASISASATSVPSATAPADTAAPSASVPAASDQPATVGTARSTGQPTVIRSHEPSWWTRGWPVVIGFSALAVAVLAALAFPLLWMTRRRSTPKAVDPGKNKAA